MRSLPALLLLLAVTACGSEEAVAPEPRTDVEISVRAEPDDDPTVTSLTCDPTGSDHPDAAAACSSLRAAGSDVLEPSDDECVEIFGGPETATIVGRLEGREVDLSFDRADGCGTYRWDALGPAVFGISVQ